MKDVTRLVELKKFWTLIALFVVGILGRELGVQRVGKRSVRKGWDEA